MKKWLIVILVLLVIPFANAICDNVTITATEPQNLNYTYSVNLPLIYTSAGATDCWVIIDSEKYYNNKSIDCGTVSTQFDVDYDGNYTAWLWSSNSSANDNCNVTMPFTIDRTSEFQEGKISILGGIIIALIIIAFFAVLFSSFLEDYFKVLILALSFAFIYSSLAIMLIAIREYIKVPAIEQIVERMFSVMIYGSVLVFMIMFVLFMTNFFKKRAKDVEKKRFGY